MRLYDTAQLLVLDSVRRDVALPEDLKPPVDRPVTEGLLERVNRGRRVPLILSRTFSQAIGESVYDPACGSVGTLLSCIAHMRDQKKEWRNVENYGDFSINLQV